MRTILVICLVFVLAGCSNMAVAPGSLADRLGIGSTEKYKARIEARKAADNAKCLELGFKPQTEAYGNCRLQLEQIRATERTARRRRTRSAPLVEGASRGRKVYDASECIGPVIMGRCKGSILPNKA